LKRRLGHSATIAACLGAAVLACGSVDDGAAGSDSAVIENVELFGNDRIGQLLRADPSHAPSTYEELEQLFKIGRACARKDTKEIFVVEERGTRDDTGSTMGGSPLPRTVTTGCNPDPQNAENIKFSYSLMNALVSSTRNGPAPDPAHGDTIVPTPLEVIAFDDTTGLFNYYKFFASKPGERPTIMRVERTPQDEIFDIILFPGDSTPVRQPAVTTNGTPTRRCFGCHINGGPIMNELEDPWTNWVSFRRQTLDLASFTARTKELVSEAVGIDGRSSFAKGLEDPLKAGMRTFVNGIPGKDGTGIGNAILQGRSPGGVPRLLRSVFCETELNYKTAFDEVPYEVFFDPAVFGASLPIKARVNPADPLPHLMPTRSEMDKRLENFLQRTRILSANTILAARLLDEENDVFSAARCGVYGDAVKDLPANTADVDAHVRAAVAKAATAIAQGPRRTLLDKLVDPAASADDVSTAKAAYTADISDRFAQKTKLLDTEEGRSQLRAEVDRRKRAAVAMFPPPASPLPEGVAIEPTLKLEAAPAFGMSMKARGEDPHELTPPPRKH
jgi:hypothetical protein